MYVTQMRDLLKTKAEALVNPVNCVGVMGAGLARQFRDKFPDNYVAYLKACENKSLVVGKVFPFRCGSKLIINFPTKKHWKNPSKLDYIKEGLPALKSTLELYRIKSVAIPMLGCGFGGLNWTDVKPLIMETFKDTKIELDIYE